MIIDQIIEYPENQVPKKLYKEHKNLTAILRELDQERNYAIPFYHNVYRTHYAMVYPLLLNKSKARKVIQIN